MTDRQVANKAQKMLDAMPMADLVILEEQLRGKRGEAARRLRLQVFDTQWERIKPNDQP